MTSGGAATPMDLLPLMQDLTAALPTWGVWKNADAGLAGIGDIDSAADKEHWPRITRLHQTWANKVGASVVFNCSHSRSVLILGAIFPGQRYIQQFDVWTECFFRGAKIFDADALVPLMMEDARGFRRLRPGAEGFFLFLLNGLKRGGTPNKSALETKNISSALEADPDGVLMASRMVGMARRPVLKAIDAFNKDDWNRPMLLVAEAYSVVRGLLSPALIARRALFRRGPLKHCPVLSQVVGGRRIPHDAEEWIRLVETDHVVVRVQDPEE